MSPKSIEVPVEPRVLEWARKGVGIGVPEVSKRLKVEEDAILKWESGDEKPTLVQLEKLAYTIYKRPLAVFFLPAPPKELPLPHDLRTLPEAQRIPFSKTTLLAIRRARRIQSLVKELSAGLDRPRFGRGDESYIRRDPEILAQREREHLGIEINTQFSWDNDYEALKRWRGAVDKVGIFVVQAPMPLEEARGFSLPDGDIPVIVLNTRDFPRPRIFSLFHEYAHLLVDYGGICDMGDPEHIDDKGKSVEVFCNRFAGALLVPRNALIQHRLVADNRGTAEWPDEILINLARDFNVSQEVVLRRMVLCDVANQNYYEAKREQWERRSSRSARRDKIVKISRARKCVSENGLSFVSLVLDSHRQGRVTYSDVADYLDIRLKHMPKLERLVQQES